MNARATFRTAPPALASVAPGGGLGSLGLAFLVMFVFLAYSRFADLFFGGVRLALATSVIAAGFAAATGGLIRALLSRPGIILTSLTVWFVITVPFSYWPGGSVQLLTDQWIKSFLVFFIVAGLIRTVKQCRIVMNTIGVSVVVIALLALLFPSSIGDGRLVVQQGVLGNPNDLAQLLLLGLPCLFLFALNGRSVVARAFVALATLTVLLIVVKTGSRAAIVTTSLVLLVILYVSTWGTRIKLLIGCALALAVVLPFAAESQLARISTILSGTERSADYQVVDGDDAVGSTQARYELLKQSLTITFQHPLFGIGPGIFQAAAAELSAQRGERGIWHDTHNTYTQISSEAGLPAFALFITLVFGSIRSTRRIYHQAHAQGNVAIANAALCLWLSLVVYAASINFASVGYHLYLPLFAGLAVALREAAAAELAQPSPAAAPQAPAAWKGPTVRPRLAAR